MRTSIARPLYAHASIGVDLDQSADQHLGEIGIDAPIVTLVGVGERGACYLPAESNVIQLTAHRAEACLDVAQTFAVSQLREGHRQILVPARETSPVRVTAITGDTLLKLVGGQVRHELSEYSLADMHPHCRQSQSCPRRQFGGNFRRKKFKSKNPNLSLDC